MTFLTVRASKCQSFKNKKRGVTSIVADRCMQVKRRMLLGGMLSECVLELDDKKVAMVTWGRGDREREEMTNLKTTWLCTAWKWLCCFAYIYT